MTHLAVISEPLNGLLVKDIVCHGQVVWCWNSYTCAVDVKYFALSHLFAS